MLQHTVSIIICQSAHTSQDVLVQMNEGRVSPLYYVMKCASQFLDSLSKDRHYLNL